MLEKLYISPEQIERLRNMPDTSSTSSTTTDLDNYGLGGVDCKICENRGVVRYIREDGERFGECSCMNVRRSMRRIRNSGMADMLNRYSMEDYETPDAVRQRIKAKALDFLQNGGGWFYIGGRSGSGKTHICTAMCKALIERGYDVRYMLWRDEAVQLKGMVNEPEYAERMKKLSAVRVLYIDDFFKGTVKEADINLAFQLLNARYNDKSLITIISSELDLKEVIGIDEALGGRIYERSRGYTLQAPNENWRLR